MHLLLSDNRPFLVQTLRQIRLIREEIFIVSDMHSQIDMKVFENEGFEGGEDDLQTKLDSLELRKQPQNDNVAVSLESSKSGARPHGNLIVRWNLRARASLRGWLVGKYQTSRIFWILLVNGAAAGFLAATLVQDGLKDSSKVDWCNGVGFLWILYFVVYISVLYYVTKKFLKKSICVFLEPLLDRISSLGGNKYFQVICYLAPFVALAVFVVISPGKSGRRIFSFLGILVFTLLGYLFSKYPAHVKWRPVVCGLVLQFGFGLLTMQWDFGKNILDCLGSKVTTFLQHTERGGSFVFGHLAKPENDEQPIFAFSVLPVIYFLSFFINILSYYGALQWCIMKISWLVKVAMGTTVCESVNATASIFLGSSEAPLLIQNYLKDLTKSEMCAILCAGWSTVAGVVLAAYVNFGVNASHLIAASVMSAPASLAYSKLVYPETESSRNTLQNVVLHREKGANVLDVASKGALNAIGVIGSIIANLIAFLAFLSFIDGTLNWIGILIGLDQLSFQLVMSKLFYPISFLMGVDEESLEDVAYLIGIKTVANEFQAYKQLGEYLKNNRLSMRSEIIVTYALCGFSNFASIGITVGAISAIEPRQSSVVTEVALPAFIAANIVCFMTACVAGCLVD